MTKLLNEAIACLQELPEGMQDSAARAILAQLQEEPEADDFDGIRQGRGDLAHGARI